MDLLRNTYRTISILIILCGYSVNAQLSIDFADNHQSQIIEVKVHPDQQHYVTRDEMGKIILWDAKKYSYIKTLFTPKYNNVTAMQWVRNGKALGITQNSNLSYSAYSSDRDRLIEGRYDTLAFNTDSLFIIPVFDTIQPVSIKASVDYLSPGYKADKIIAVYGPKGTTIYPVSTDTTTERFYISSPYPHQYAADVNTSEHQILLGTSNHFVYGNSILTLMRTDDYTVLDTTEINFKPQYILFDDQINKYLIIGYSSRKKQFTSAFYDPEEKSIGRIQTFGDTSYSFNDPIYNTYKRNNNGFFITLNISRTLQYVFEYTGGELKPFEIDPRIDFYRATPFFLTERKLMGAYHYNSMNNARTKNDLEIWDYEQAKQIDGFEMKSRPISQASFLPDGSWLVRGDLSFGRPFLKYFPSDKLLSNKFSSTYFLDYLQSSFGITHVRLYSIDDLTGKIVFNGWKNDQKQFFIYDLIKDRITNQFNDPKDEYLNSIDFSGKKDRILVNDGFQPSLALDGYYKVRILDEKGSISLKTPVVQSILSSNGDYLLTLDRQNTIRVFQISSKLKKIYEKNFQNLTVSTIKKTQNNGFTLSTFKLRADFTMKSYLIHTDQHELVVEEFDNLELKDHLKSRNYSATLFALGNFRSLIISSGEKILYEKSFNSDDLTPNSIRIHPEESRMFLNCEEGITEILDLKTFETIGKMIHLGAKEQVIVSSSFFSANCNVSRLLIASKEGEIIEPSNWIDTQNKPVEVVHLFGDSNNEYKSFLRTVENINRSQEKQTSADTNSSQLSINSITFPTLSGQKVTNQKQVEVIIQYAGKQESIDKIELTINGGYKQSWETSDPAVSINPRSIKLNARLVNDENHMSFNLLSTDSIYSKTHEEFLVKSIENKGNLYLLSIGVSEYEDSRYDLTFADKDAMDIAVIYGDTNDINVSQYEHKFYSDKYAVSGSKALAYPKKINHFNPDDYGYSTVYLYPADQKGRFWVELKRNSIVLWDFSTGKRKIIIEDPKTSFAYKNVLPTDDNQGFFISDGYSFGGEELYFKFSSMAFAQSYVPENTIRCKSKTTFITFEYDYSTPNTPTYYYEVEVAKNEVSSRRKLPIRSYKEAKKVSFDVIAINSKANQILLKNDKDQLFLVNQNENEPTVNPLPQLSYEMSSDYILKDSLIYILNSIEKKFMIYNLITNNTTLEQMGDEFSGVNLFSQSPVKIRKTPPLAERTISTLGRDKALETFSKVKPVSFEHIIAHCIVDSNATQKNIISALEELAGLVRPDDQVILFMAGHGVLNKKREFLFAPHDMDFVEIDQKGINYKTIIRRIEELKTANKLILFDACHSGNLFSEEVMTSTIEQDTEQDNNGQRGAIRLNQSRYNPQEIQEAADFLFESVISSSGVTVLSASSGDDVAYEGMKELSNGNFTASIIGVLIENLSESDIFFLLKEQSDSIQLTNDILYQINQNILSNSQGRQIPNIREINAFARIFLW